MIFEFFILVVAILLWHMKKQNNCTGLGQSKLLQSNGIKSQAVVVATAQNYIDINFKRLINSLIHL